MRDALVALQNVVEAKREGRTIVAPRVALLRWTRLFTDAAGAVLLVATMPVQPAYLGLAGLVVYGSLRSLVTRALSERHGVIIYALWRRGGSTVTQRVDRLLPDVNRELRQLKKRRMTESELQRKLEWLAEFGCVVATLPGWRLKDSVWLTK